MKTNLGKQIPGWAQGVILIGITVGVGIVSWRIWKGIKAKRDNKGNSDEQKEVIKELVELNSNPATKATIGEDHAAMIANQVFAAMNGYGTDETAIRKALEPLQNNADFLMVSAAYGIRTLSTGKWNPDPDIPQTFVGALATEFGSEKGVINAILNKKGITYKI